MKSLFVILCVSFVFLVSCGGGGGGVPIVIPTPPTGSLQVMVYSRAEGSTRTNPLVGVDVALWKSQTEMLRSGETGILGGWYPCGMPVGDYLVTVRGEIEDHFYKIWDYPNDEWFPVTIRKDETTKFEYTVEYRRK